jgi:hypothetical protein
MPSANGRCAWQASRRENGYGDYKSAGKRSAEESDYGWARSVYLPFHGLSESESVTTSDRASFQ